MTVLTAGVLPWYVVLVALAVLVITGWACQNGRVAAVVLLALSSVELIRFGWWWMAPFGEYVGPFSNPALAGAARHSLPLCIPFAALFWFVHVLLSRVHRQGRENPHGFLLAPSLFLLVYAVFALLWSPNLNWTVVPVTVLAVNVMACAVFVRVLADAKRLRQTLWAFAWIGIIHAMTIIGSYFLQEPIHELWPPEGGLSFELEGGVTTRYHNFRQAGFLYDYHFTATMLNMHFAAMLGLLLVERGTCRRIFLGSAAALMLLVGFASNTRGHILGLLGMSGFLIWSLPGLRKRWLPVGAATLLALFFIMRLEYRIIGAVHGSGVEIRAENAQGREGSDVDGRVYIWEAAWWYLVRSLGFGIGTENFVVFDTDERDIHAMPHPHSILLSIILDYGVAGVLFLAWAGTAGVRQYRRVLRSGAPEQQRIAIALAGGGVALAVHGLIDFHHNIPFVWCYLGLFTAVLTSGANGWGDARLPVCPMTAGFSRSSAPGAKAGG